jgi:hypothetical protein
LALVCESTALVENGLLHSQAFTNSHLHFLVFVESATYRVLLQRSKLRFGLFYVSSSVVQPRLIAWQQPYFYWDGIFKLVLR